MSILWSLNRYKKNLSIFSRKNTFKKSWYYLDKRIVKFEYDFFLKVFLISVIITIKKSILRFLINWIKSAIFIIWIFNEINEIKDSSVNF